MNDPYHNNPMWEDMQPGYLIPGHKYDLVINKVPFRPEALNSPLIRTNMVFIRHDMHPNTHAFQDMHILKFKYEENNNTMIVENTPLNRIYRLRKVSDHMKEPVITYINKNTTEPNETNILYHPDSVNIVFDKYGINDPLVQDYMGKLGGKRKNNKKKTKKSKKLIGGRDEPPSIHPQMNMINNLTVGEYYSFDIQDPNGEEFTYHGRLLPLTNQHVEDPSLRIEDYSRNNVPQQGWLSFPRSFVQRAYSISTQPLPPQPPFGGKKMSRKKAKSVRKKSKSLKKNRKTKKTKKN